MGNVSSRPEDSSPLFLRDQSRLTVTSLRICASNNRTLYSVLPDAIPACRYTVRKETDDGNIEYVQDPEVSCPGSLPSILLRLSSDDEIHFYFTFALRPPSLLAEAKDVSGNSPLDTVINSLTFVFAPTLKELDSLVTRQFNSDPNIHKHPNVDLVGDYSTAGKQQEQFEWSWRWRPPKQTEDRGGGWRNSCSFVEYDQRTHRLSTLITFSFWVQSAMRRPHSPVASHSPRIDNLVPPKIRLPSQRSIESRLSDSDTEVSAAREPTSPFETIHEDKDALEAVSTSLTVKVDLGNATLDGDITSTDDGPVFRATMKNLESKTGSVRQRMKKVLKKAEATREAQINNNACVSSFISALKDASETNSNAVQPALDHYFAKIAQEILQYERENSEALQKMVIDPLERIYSSEIKQVESKKKDFEDHSRDYYKDVSKYLGQRSDSMKEKKRAESDSKYETKRRTFELKRFDYSAFMQDLHGGRKDQEVLSHLTSYADAQAQGYLATAKRIESMLPQLDALTQEVREADKQYQLLRSEREEKRRALEKSSKMPSESDMSQDQNSATEQAPPVPPLALSSRPQSEIDASHASSASAANSNVTEKRLSVANGAGNATAPDANNAASPDVRSSSQFSASPSVDRYKGIRDLESTNLETRTTAQRKEGLLWSLSKPGSHMVDPRMKISWHKFWVVLDQGRISEYVNWKSNPEKHMEPIDLRMASVREARNQERRFCFEVITPQFTRIYQTTGEEDMRSWIQAINNALQSAFEGKTSEPSLPPAKTSNSIAQNLFGKSSSYHGHRSTSSSAKSMGRYPTVGDRPPIQRSRSSEERPAVLLNNIRSRDEGNKYCADCGSDKRVEWVSINLGLIICIECSGIHRSLGTHISKIRSLTLDTNSFTQDVVELIMALGNRVSNMIWEAKLDLSQKPPPEAPREQRLAFITAKYQHRAYIRPVEEGFSHYSSPDQTLLASVKKNDIQNVYYALALAANPNAVDGSRATHVVFLALAAADPASPFASSPKTSPLSPAKSSADVSQQRKAFPVAELLIQNGAEVPNQQAPIPLSDAARMYVDFKKAQKAGRLAVNSSAAQPPPNSYSTGGVATNSTKLSKRSSAGQNVAKFARNAGMLPER
ncbi:MAG: hypothetical protein Q9162_003916 [Coniocarpon cinnabarinum]